MKTVLTLGHLIKEAVRINRPITAAIILDRHAGQIWTAFPRSGGHACSMPVSRRTQRRAVMALAAPKAPAVSDAEWIEIGRRNLPPIRRAA